MERIIKGPGRFEGLSSGRIQRMTWYDSQRNIILSKVLLECRGLMNAGLMVDDQGIQYFKKCQCS